RAERGYADALKLSEGLLYMRARVYDPRSRRFLQADTVDSRRYSYVAGDPTNYRDPSGHVAARDPETLHFLQLSGFGGNPCMDGMCGSGVAPGYTDGASPGTVFFDTTFLASQT